MSEKICDNCPAKRDTDAAEKVIVRQLDGKLMSAKEAEIGRVLIARRLILIDETRQVHNCDGPMLDDNTKTLSCPLPLGRVDFLANSTIDSNVQSAHNAAGNTRGLGFKAPD